MLVQQTIDFDHLLYLHYTCLGKTQLCQPFALHHIASALSTKNDLHNVFFIQSTHAVETCLKSTNCHMFIAHALGNRWFQPVTVPTLQMLAQRTTDFDHLFSNITKLGEHTTDFNHLFHHITNALDYKNEDIKFKVGTNMVNYCTYFHRKMM